MASKEITPELIKRVETALKTANIAMRSLRDENKRLKEQIAQLEERLKAGSKNEAVTKAKTARKRVLKPSLDSDNTAKDSISNSVKDPENASVNEFVQEVTSSSYKISKGEISKAVGDPVDSLDPVDRTASKKRKLNGVTTQNSRASSNAKVSFSGSCPSELTSIQSLRHGDRETERTDNAATDSLFAWKYSDSEDENEQDNLGNSLENKIDDTSLHVSNDQVIESSALMSDPQITSPRGDPSHASSLLDKADNLVDQDDPLPTKDSNSNNNLSNLSKLVENEKSPVKSVDILLDHLTRSTIHEAATLLVRYSIDMVSKAIYHRLGFMQRFDMKLFHNHMANILPNLMTVAPSEISSRYLLYDEIYSDLSIYIDLMVVISSIHAEGVNWVEYTLRDVSRRSIGNVTEQGHDRISNDSDTKGDKKDEDAHQNDESPSHIAVDNEQESNYVAMDSNSLNGKENSNQNNDGNNGIDTNQNSSSETLQKGMEKVSRRDKLHVLLFGCECPDVSRHDTSNARGLPYPIDQPIYQAIGQPIDRSEDDKTRDLLKSIMFDDDSDSSDASSVSDENQGNPAICDNKSTYLTSNDISKADDETKQRKSSDKIIKPDIAAAVRALFICRCSLLLGWSHIAYEFIHSIFLACGSDISLLRGTYMGVLTATDCTEPMKPVKKGNKIATNSLWIRDSDSMDNWKEELIAMFSIMSFSWLRSIDTMKYPNQLLKRLTSVVDGSDQVLPSEKPFLISQYIISSCTRRYIARWIASYTSSNQELVTDVDNRIDGILDLLYSSHKARRSENSLTGDYVNIASEDNVLSPRSRFILSSFIIRQVGMVKTLSSLLTNGKIDQTECLSSKPSNQLTNSQSNLHRSDSEGVLTDAEILGDQVLSKLLHQVIHIGNAIENNSTETSQLTIKWEEVYAFDISLQSMQPHAAMHRSAESEAALGSNLPNVFHQDEMVLCGINHHLKLLQLNESTTKQSRNLVEISDQVIEDSHWANDDGKSSDHMDYFHSLLRSMKTLSVFADSFLSLSVYDNKDGGGWRMIDGSSQHMSLASRIEIKLKLLKVHMQKLNIIYTPSSYIDPINRNILQRYLRYGTAYGRDDILQQAYQHIDYCRSYLQSHLSAASDHSMTSLSPEQHVELTKLRSLVLEFEKMFFLVLIERCIGVLTAFIRGFMVLCSYLIVSSQNEPGTNQMDGQTVPLLAADRGISSLGTYQQYMTSELHRKEFLEVFDRVIQYIIALPSPWGYKMNSEICVDLLNALNARGILRKIIDQETYGRVIDECRLLHLSWMQHVGEKVPCFVINLESRRDRWYFTQALCFHHDLQPIRIDALNGMDKALQIPENDVSKTWNSTLNSKYDSNCIPGQSIAMTSTERACAASHLKVWKIIANLSVSPSKAHSSSILLYSKDSSETEQHIADRIFSLAKLEHGWHNLLHRERSLSSTRNLIGNMETQKKSIMSYDDWFLILEDDATIPHSLGCIRQLNIRLLLYEIISKIPPDCDICYLGYNLPEVFQHLQEPYSTAYKIHFRKINYLWGLSSYILKRKSVSILLSNLPIDSPADCFMARLIHDKHLVAYILQDPIFRQNGRGHGRFPDKSSKYDDVNLSKVIHSAVGYIPQVSRKYKRKIN